MNNEHEHEECIFRYPKPDRRRPIKVEKNILIYIIAERIMFWFLCFRSAFNAICRIRVNRSLENWNYSLTQHTRSHKHTHTRWQFDTWHTLVGVSGKLYFIIVSLTNRAPKNWFARFTRSSHFHFVYQKQYKTNFNHLVPSFHPISFRSKIFCWSMHLRCLRFYFSSVRWH